MYMYTYYVYILCIHMYIMYTCICIHNMYNNIFYLKKNCQLLLKQWMLSSKNLIMKNSNYLF